MIAKRAAKHLAGETGQVANVQAMPEYRCWRLTVCITAEKVLRCYHVDIYLDEFLLLKHGRKGKSKYWRKFDVTLSWNAIDHQMRINAATGSRGERYYKPTAIGKAA